MLSIFTSQAGEAAYEAAYEAMLLRWTVPYESRFVRTRLGLTHVLTAGPRDAMPIVLLPAVAVSAAEWFANVGSLSRHFRIFAFDIVGDAGLSRLFRQPRAGADYADWLSEAFMRLGIEKPAVAGHSYGGWLALQLALHRPNEVGPIALLAPASGLAPFHWHTRLILQLAERLPFRPGARRILELQAHKDFLLDEAFVSLMEAETRHVRTRVLFPRLFTDGELQRIASPVLLAVGEDETLYDPGAAIDRAEANFTDVQCAMLHACGHLIPQERPGALTSLLTDFLHPATAEKKGARLNSGPRKLFTR